MTAGDIGGRRLAIALAFVLILFAGGALIFARAQNVWIDETTQLSGMALPVGTLLAWLAGAIRLPLGVPADRMPPVSYLFDHLAWLALGQGGEPLAFRLLHALVLGAGLALLMVAVARRFSARAAIIAGLFLALSPKLIDTAVEIRAYPLFAAVSCAQIALLLWGNVAARPARLALFVLLGLLSAYLHFFGVVATSAYFVAVLADAPRLRDAIRAVVAYAVMALLWLGLAPFATGAAAISSHGAPPPLPGAGELTVFIFQLLGSAVQMIDPVAAFLYFGGAMLLLALGALGLVALIARDGFVARHAPAVDLALALAAGVMATMLASFVVKGFDALAPRYNIWMLPLLAVLIGVAADGLVSLPGTITRWARLAALAALAIGAIWAHAVFLSRPSLYIHGPSSEVEQMVARAGRNSAVVYLPGDRPTWSWGYFPLYWKHRDALPQWLLTLDGGGVIRIGRGGDAGGPVQPLGALASYDALVLVRIDLQGYRDLRLVAHGEAQPAVSGALAPALTEQGWQPQESLAKPGFYALWGQIYHHRTAP